MGIDLRVNTVNQIARGVTIYSEGEPVESVCLVLKGRVLVEKRGVRLVIGSGNFLGVSDLEEGVYGVSYTAFDNAVVFPFAARERSDIENIIASNREYGSLMVASFSKYIKELKDVQKSLLMGANTLYTFLKVQYDLYKKCCRENGYEVKPNQNLEVMDAFAASHMASARQLNYYVQCADTPIDVQKAFYRNSTICLYHIEEQTVLVREIIEESVETAEYFDSLRRELYGVGGDNLFRLVSGLLIQLKQSGKKVSMQLQDSLDEIIEQLNQTEDVLLNKAGISLDINRDDLEDTYFKVLAGAGAVETEPMSMVDQVVRLENSVDRILGYGELEEDKAERLKELVDKFYHMKDKSAADDNSRTLRREIVSIYYSLYEKVFFRAVKDSDCPIAVELFLKYGLFDERLLTKEELVELVNLEKDERGKPCHVYNMKEWLTLIYEGKRLPSKSEFDQDFEEHLRELKKNKEITEEEAKEQLKDPVRRVQYEIRNMFAYNNRIVSGQITSFVPFLYENSFIGGPAGCRLTAQIINEAVKKIRSIDYSLFCRESLYENQEAGIKKEYVVKEVFPDIILMPIGGSNGVMWQEISGRRRDSKGRFLLPAFMNGRLEEVLVQMCGRFRWEICRTIQGAMWNNIKYKSLTSEYMDYIQFYRKNRDLSEERKEKIKLQLQKARSNAKEVFVQDYETWVKNESQGSIRMNKVAREILAFYCPFSVNIRESVKNQPIFADAMQRYIREKAAKVKEIDLRYRMLEKEGVTIPEELIRTQEYYRDK